MNIEQLKIIARDSDDIKSSIVLELIDRLQAAESKLEEMAKAKPIGYLSPSNEFRHNTEAKDEYEWGKRFTPVFLHPQVQSNADKEIDKAYEKGYSAGLQDAYKDCQ